MDKRSENLLAAMTDVGCSLRDKEKATALLAAGDMHELNRHLRKCRCALVDKMHSAQQKVDLMDYIIRESKQF